MKSDEVPFYRHYKGKDYKYLSEVVHSETQETMVLYETRYENEVSSLWVRPKDIFFSQVEHEGRGQPRFQKVDIRFKITEKLSAEDKARLGQLLDLVFGSYDMLKFNSKLDGRGKIMLVTCFQDDQLIGFKLGYGLTDETFYSWLGGVRPSHRGLNLGKAMMDRQHSWCVENNFKVIETKTLNKWKAMLLLNIQSDFEVVGIEANTQYGDKILLRKMI